MYVTHSSELDPYLIDMVAGRIELNKGDLVRAVREIRSEHWPAVLQLSKQQRRELVKRACAQARR